MSNRFLGGFGSRIANWGKERLRVLKRSRLAKLLEDERRHLERHMAVRKRRQLGITVRAAAPGQKSELDLALERKNRDLKWFETEWAKEKSKLGMGKVDEEGNPVQVEVPWGAKHNEEAELAEMLKQRLAEEAAEEGGSDEEGSEEAEEAEEEEYSGPTGLATVALEETVWDRRIATMRAAVLGNPVTEKVTEKVEEASEKLRDSELGEKLEDLQDTIHDEIEDVRETYETSQHPLVWRVRDLEDAVTAETDTGYVVGRIMEVDPEFELGESLDQMRDYMVPLFMEAYMRRRPEDKALLRRVCDESVQDVLTRLWMGIPNDMNLVDVSEVELMDNMSTVENQRPLLGVSFVATVMDCTRDEETREVVPGSETVTSNFVVVWKLERVEDDEFFDWRIAEMAVQKQELLM